MTVTSTMRAARVHVPEGADALRVGHVDVPQLRVVDVVYHSVGASIFQEGLNLLKPRGMMVLFGQASGAVAPLDPKVPNQKGPLYLTRPMPGAYIATRNALEVRQTTGKVVLRIPDEVAA